MLNLSTRSFPTHLLLSALAICAPVVFAAENTPQATAVSTPVLASGTPVYGATLTFTTRVSTASPGPGFTAFVRFIVDGFETTPFPIDGNGASSISKRFSAGPHSIGARYEGDSNYLPSSSGALNQLVDKASISIAMASNPAQLNQAVAIRAAPTFVSPASGTPGGTMDFANGGIAIEGCTTVPVQNGVGICNTSFSQLGTFPITVVYNGDANTKPGSGSMQLTLGKVVAGIYAATASVTPVFGATVTVNGLLLGAAGAPAPTGMIAFSDRAATLATIPVGPDGKASLSIPSASLAALSVGPHAIAAVYNGDANYQTSTAATLNIVVSKAATILALAATPAQIGQPVTLKAAVTVVSPGNATPGGALDFSSGGTAIAGCTGIPLRNGIATCGTSFAQLGDYSIGAGYSGDANTTSSTANIQVTAGKAVAGIYSASTPATPVFGFPVSVGALLLGAPGLPTPSGSVTFSDGAAVWAPVPVGADGRASLSRPLAVGGHSFLAVYSGDANYAGSTASALSVVVKQASTSTALTASPGAPLTATVTILPPGAGTPTGIVQFFQGGAPIEAAPVVQLGSGFVATIPAGLRSGSVWAVYQGDASFSGSTSQAVAAASRALVSIVSSQNPSVAGQPVTLTVQVSAGAGAGTPTGSVQFLDGGASLGTAALAGGQATFTATFTVGAHTVTARYSGDAIYPAGDASFQQVASKPATQVILTSNPGSTVYGQPVAFTAQLTSPGASPSGTVRFSDGAAAIGSARASAGVATLTVTTLSAGAHSVTAIWAGDDDPAVAVSTPLPQTVNKARTSTATAVLGLTLNSTVTVVAPGAGTPSGVVKFLDPATNAVLASAVLAGGGASVVLSSAAGPVVATYSGDSNFQPSISAAVTPLTAVNAASYTGASFAPDEIVTLFGSSLATATASSPEAPALSLGGTTVTVTDSAGVRHAATILFVSPAQASFLMPADAAPGPSIVSVTNGNQASVSTAILLTPVAPGLFTLNNTGQGVPAGQTVRVRADGTQDAPQSVAVFDKVQSQWVRAPIDLGAPADTVYLVLYGTGLRHYSVRPACTVAGLRIPVAFAGAQSGFPGLDQVNIILPGSLRGAGTVDLSLTADGIASNTVTLAFQ